MRAAGELLRGSVVHSTPYSPDHKEMLEIAVLPAWRGVLSGVHPMVLSVDGGIANCPGRFFSKNPPGKYSPKHSPVDHFSSTFF